MHGLRCNAPARTSRRPPLCARRGAGLAETFPPVAAQGRDEVGGALVREKEPGAVDLDQFGYTGNGVAEPVGPAHAEEDVAGAPYDERGHGQAPQLVLD